MKQVDTNEIEFPNGENKQREAANKGVSVYEGLGSNPTRLFFLTTLTGCGPRNKSYDFWIYKYNATVVVG
jgi:hypothetical protein